jgi:hypothetical protein
MLEWSVGQRSEHGREAIGALAVISMAATKISAKKIG